MKKNNKKSPEIGYTERVWHGGNHAGEVVYHGPGRWEAIPKYSEVGGDFIDTKQQARNITLELYLRSLGS